MTTPCASTTVDTVYDELLDAYAGLWEATVHNDDVTTFDTVIKALVDVFGHTSEAAEALAWIVHRQGQAQVAIGDKDYVVKGVRELLRRGVQASGSPLV